MANNANLDRLARADDGTIAKPRAKSNFMYRRKKWLESVLLYESHAKNIPQQRRLNPLTLMLMLVIELFIPK